MAERPATLTTSKFDHATSTTDVNEVTPNATKPHHFALALSGGGFRATLFHLGVMLYLRDAGKLANIARIVSVSGGSITAAYLLANWERFLGDDAAVSSKLIDFAQKDIIGRAIGRGLRRRSSRTMRLTEIYDSELFGGAALSALKTDAAPPLYVMGTNLTTGRPVAFCAEGIYLGIKEKDDRAIDTDMTLAAAVAASSSYPVVFEGIEITRKKLALTSSEMPQERVLITDGGVRDNSGLEFLAQLSTTNGANAVVQLVSSDARRAFDQSKAESLIPALDRSFEIATVQLDRFRENMVAPLFVRLTDDPGDSSVVPTHIARHLRFMRTNFDAVSDAEAFALVGHGYGVAKCRLSGLGGVVAPVDERDWKKTLGRSVPALSASHFAESDRLRIAHHFAVPVAILVAVILFAVASVYWWKRPSAPTYEVTLLATERSADVREKWITALLNDLSREGEKSAPADGCATQGVPSACVSTEVLSFGPFDRAIRGSTLQGHYDSTRFTAGGFAFLRTADSYVPLNMVANDGMLSVTFDGADSGDRLLVILRLVSRPGETSSPDAARVLHDWSFR